MYARSGHARECLEYLAIRPDGVYLDATAGLGGHTGAIARRLTTGLVLACDRDAESLELARANTADCADRAFVFTEFRFRRWERRWRPKGLHKWTGCWRTWGSRGTS